jgi:hypothetical protein
VFDFLCSPGYALTEDRLHLAVLGASTELALIGEFRLQVAEFNLRARSRPPVSTPVRRDRLLGRIPVTALPLAVAST